MPLISVSLQSPHFIGLLSAPNIFLKIATLYYIIKVMGCTFNLIYKCTPHSRTLYLYWVKNIDNRGSSTYNSAFFNNFLHCHDPGVQNWIQIYHLVKANLDFWSFRLPWSLLLHSFSFSSRALTFEAEMYSGLFETQNSSTNH